MEPGGVSSQRDEAPPGPEQDLQAKLSFHSARTEGALDSDSEIMEVTEKLLQLQERKARRRAQSDALIRAEVEQQTLQETVPRAMAGDGTRTAEVGTRTPEAKPKPAEPLRIQPKTAE